jgi:ubiquinone/menaquinone biosynthesis C-methylase UbiE
MSPRDGVTAAVERDVFREACGSEGYLTTAQASTLARALRVTKQQLVLDLGSGRGWPGRRIAEITGCDVVFADLPRRELLDALARSSREGLSARTNAVVADGAALPFRSRSFDAIVHADVMC